MLRHEYLRFVVYDLQQVERTATFIDQMFRNKLQRLFHLVC